VLLHDNDHPHAVSHTAEILWKIKFDVMAHRPLYSPNLAPSAYYLFGPLRGILMPLHRT
jgi:hypothetical protein